MKPVIWETASWETPKPVRPPSPWTALPPEAASVLRPDVALLVPTRNAGFLWRDWCEALRRQTVKPGWALVADSESRDATPLIAARYGLQVTRVDARTFDHGLTRNRMAAMVPKAEILVYLTQDAVLADPQALERLLEPFADPAVAIASGRQLPRPGAGEIEAQARLFNYPDQSRRIRKTDIPEMGIKAAFVSNSFCAWRAAALTAIGGFPSTIMGEDTLAAARLLLSGAEIAYVAEARVYHSHAYSIREESRRYFDIGVFHARFAAELEAFGRPEGEGRRFVRAQLEYLRKAAPGLIPGAILRIGCKYAGYRLGRKEHFLPRFLKRRLSLHPGWWRKPYKVSA